ncbi:hypothetical protein PVAG01_10167 [Phlyctema vagabunda]|uniref:Myb-like domain-containing protein n=1 Tax=Phlyctema vagabunda TaxID=108571 RepID=A0ABR4P582_9HELO
MATFVPISYTYVPTAPRSKTATARLHPSSKQSSILEKLQRSNLNVAGRGTPQPAAASDIRKTISTNDSNENKDDYGLPSVEKLLYTTLQKDGFAAEVQHPRNRGSGFGMPIAEGGGGSLHDNRWALGSKSGESLGDPIILLGDDDSRASEAEANDDGLPIESTAVDRSLLDLNISETAIYSTKLAPTPNSDGWDHIDDFVETAQRPHTGGQLTVRARSEALCPMLVGDEHNARIRPAQNADIFDQEERPRQEEQEDEDSEQLHQEVDGDAAAALMNGEADDIHSWSETSERLRPANHNSIPESSHNWIANHSNRYSGVELENNHESEDDDESPRPTKRKRLSPSNGSSHEKRKSHSEQRSPRQHVAHSNSHPHFSEHHSPPDDSSTVTSDFSHGRCEGPGCGSLFRVEEEPQEQRGDQQYHEGAAEEASRGTHQSEGNGCSHNTDNEDDEEPALMKRRKLHSLSTDVALTPALERSLRPRLRQTRSPIPSSTTGSARDESPPSADHRYLTPAISQSPAGKNTSAASAPVAKYREWPFQGFLKCVMIECQTTYNFEFSLPCISERLNLSGHSDMTGPSSREPSAEDAVTYPSVMSRKLDKPLTKAQEILLAEMVREDETWKKIGERFPGHTLQALKENFFKKQGGKPRKRGRKPGLRGR